MSIESITQKILTEATESAEQLLSKVRGDREALLASAAKQSESIHKEMEAKAETDAKLLKERKISVAELEARKLELSTKQDAISKSFALALEFLASMEQEKYIELLVAAVSETGVDGGELLLNKTDREAVGKKVVDAVNAKAGPTKVSLAEGTIEAKGGFVLRKGAVEINATLETMVNAVKEAVTSEVVEALF